MSSKSEPKPSASQVSADGGQVQLDGSYKSAAPLFVRVASEPTAKQVP